jgi:hypothetical protein
MRNPKHKILNSKQFQIFKIQMFQTIRFEFGEFGFGICLGFSAGGGSAFG